jgi:HSP90 family molecular chaperone
MCGGFASPMPLSNNYFYKPTALRGLHVGQDCLELNPDHPIFFKMCNRFENNEHDAVLVACAELLLGYALLAEGTELPDPSKFNRLLAGCILHAL